MSDPTHKEYLELGMMAHDDPESPQNWPLWKKMATSFCAFMPVFSLLLATTMLSIPVSMFPMLLKTSSHLAILAFSIPFFAVATAPLHTPHLSEQFGRKPVWMVSTLLLGAVVLGGAYATTIYQILAIRFVAGLVGGPTAVLIEGTFADLWSADRTVTYYIFIALAQYLGAAFGPVIGVYAFQNKGVKWLSFVPVIFIAFSLLLVVLMPETYPRELLRRRVRKSDKVSRRQAAKAIGPAPSGSAISEMVKLTVLNPLRMIVTEPIVLLFALYLGLQFATVFQLFITVPYVLQNVYNFTLTHIGLAVLSAVGGSIAAAVTTALLDGGIAASQDRRDGVKIERRMYPAMLGSLWIVASLFWIGWTSKPSVHVAAPAVGVGFFVWGNMSIVLSLISYIFDAYTPQGTLSALTAMAVFRLVCAGLIPVFIMDMFMNLTGKWVFGTFGFIAVGMLPIPYVVFFFGEKMRAGSKFSM